MDVGISPSVVVNNHISVQVAAELSGYSLQYLRRLLRNGKLAGLKIGQVWLIDKSAFKSYLKKAVQATDQRFGPKQVCQL
jgi:excisionase family DNA binding protein